MSDESVPTADELTCDASAGTYAAACDASALEALLNRNPRCATAVGDAHRNEPLVYLCMSTRFRKSKETGDASVRCAELLLRAGASPNTLTIEENFVQDGLPVLYFVCANNNVGVARALLTAGADPNDGESTYHAAEHNHRECLALLLAAGADLSSAHHAWDNTPLYFLAGHKPFSALCASSELGMLWLLEHGADPNVRSYSRSKDTNAGETPLHRVAAFGKNAALARKLVHFKAVVDAKRADGATPYMLALRSGNDDVAALLLELGARDSVATPADHLMHAFITGDEAEADRLTTADASLALLSEPEREHLIISAIEQNRVNAIQLMIRKGWDIHQEESWGGTPLHHAAWHGRPDVVRLLLSSGAPLNTRDRSYGSSPLGWAGHGSINARPGHDDEYIDVINQLRAAGATRTESINKWNEPPESLASEAVAVVLRRR